MKNIEKYEREISQLVNEGQSLECSIAYVSGISEEKRCFDMTCEECHKKCLKWMYSEYNEPILSDDEKDIIKPMIDTILKFGCHINCVAKEHYVDGSFYISISYKNDVIGHKECITSPCFTNDKFKGMELEKEYTLEELGISCPKQKDNYVRQ